MNFSDKIQAPSRPEGRSEPRPTTYDSALEDRAILSFSLLLAVLVAGVVMSLIHAEPNPSLFTLLN